MLRVFHSCAELLPDLVQCPPMSKKSGKDHHEGEMEKKFADFDRMIAEAKKSGIEAVLVPSPQTLGDTYDEIVRNLTKLQEAELTLVIVPRPKK
jgi:hypothetical protein